MKQFGIPWCLFIVCVTVIMAYSADVLYLPVKVKSLQQLYPALSGRHTVRRNRLLHFRAHRHPSKHQQRSDGKPAPEPRMHTHSEHLLQVTEVDTQNRGEETRMENALLEFNSTETTFIPHYWIVLLSQPRVGL